MIEFPNPLTIVKYPHPMLRHKSLPVTRIDDRIRNLVREMFGLMYTHKGIGLAAPQVGVPLQLFILNITGDAEKPDEEKVFINPVVSNRRGGVAEAEEGCLSFPDLFQNVRRPKLASIKAYDENGQPIDIDAKDLLARAVQHETDHLHGILFIDKFGPIARLSSRGLISKLKREHAAAQKKGELPKDVEIQRQLEALKGQE